MTLLLKGAGKQTPAAASSFSPSDISGMLFWHRTPITGLVDGDPVGSWPDDSGAAAHATQGVATSKPTYKTDVTPHAVLYDAVNDNLESPVSAATKPFTAFMVLKPTDLLAIRTVFAASASGGLSIDIDVTTGNLRMLKMGELLIGTSTSGVAAAFGYFVATYDGSGNWAFRINGAAAGSGTSDQTFSASTTRLGFQAGGVFKGHIREAGKYNVVVGGGSLASLETYLAGRL